MPERGERTPEEKRIARNAAAERFYYANKERISFIRKTVKERKDVLDNIYRTANFVNGARYIKFMTLPQKYIAFVAPPPIDGTRGTAEQYPPHLDATNCIGFTQGDVIYDFIDHWDNSLSLDVYKKLYPERKRLYRPLPHDIGLLYRA